MKSIFGVFILLVVGCFAIMFGDSLMPHQPRLFSALLAGMAIAGALASVSSYLNMR